MTNEELVAEFKRTKSNRIFEELLNQNIGTIKKLSIENFQSDYEDWEQEAKIATLKAANDFDPMRGVKFITLMTKYIKTQFLSFRHKYRNDFRNVPLEEAKDVQDKAVEAGQSRDLHSAINQLSSWKKRAVVKVYFSQERHSPSEKQQAWTALPTLRRHLDFQSKTASYQSKRR